MKENLFMKTTLEHYRTILIWCLLIFCMFIFFALSESPEYVFPLGPLGLIICSIFAIILTALSVISSYLKIRNENRIIEVNLNHITADKREFCFVCKTEIRKEKEMFLLSYIDLMNYSVFHTAPTAPLVFIHKKCFYDAAGNEFSKGIQEGPKRDLLDIL